MLAEDSGVEPRELVALHRQSVSPMTCHCFRKCFSIGKGRLQAGGGAQRVGGDDTIRSPGFCKHLHTFFYRTNATVFLQGPLLNFTFPVVTQMPQTSPRLGQISSFWHRRLRGWTTFLLVWRCGLVGWPQEASSCRLVLAAKNNHLMHIEVR